MTAVYDVMTRAIAAAVGIGLIVSLVFSEAFGLAAGGMVVPGYMAVALGKPPLVVGTIAAAIVTFLIVRIMGQFMLLYGRRHLVVVILIGFALGFITREFLTADVGHWLSLGGSADGAWVARFPSLPTLKVDFGVVGFIIPGLIAYWMERQGALVTLATMTTASALVRLVLIVVGGGDPIPVPSWW